MIGLCFSAYHELYTYKCVYTRTRTHTVYTLDNANASGTVPFKPRKVLREKELHYNVSKNSLD